LIAARRRSDRGPNRRLQMTRQRQDANVLAAASHWRSDLMEGWRRLRAFIVVTGVAPGRFRTSSFGPAPRDSWIN
jgi:hypothetical protein